MTDEQAETCLRCNGAGVVNVDNATPVTTVIGMVSCPRCGGRGRIYCSEFTAGKTEGRKP